ncbi:MAG: hypothetical protein WBF38_09915 [Nitrosotalea sp.]
MQSFGQKQYSTLISWAVFLSTLTIVLISLVPVIFPALILRSFGGLQDYMGVNPFETGIWTYPFLAVNFIVFGLAVLYFKNKLPQLITKSIRFIFDFEVSALVTSLVITILIGLYIVFSVTQIYNGVYDDDYYARVQSWLQNYDLAKPTSETLGYHLMLFFEVVSMKVFASYKAIPFISDVALLVLTYFITVEMTKKRFAGIVAMVIVLQSTIFLTYQTYVSYPNFWILFYLLSLYLIYKKWPLSPIPYVASIFTKILTAVFIPMTLFFIYRSDVSQKRKIYSVISYAIIVLIGAAYLYTTHANIAGAKLDLHKFWDGFTAVYISLRYDGLVLLFMLPLTVGLFIASRKGYLQADSVLFLIMSMLISAPLVESLSDTINVPYRFVPLVVFFAMGVGTLLSKKVS